jgi:hypothetical protein
MAPQFRKLLQHPGTGRLANAPAIDAMGNVRMSPPQPKNASRMWSIANG